ncbi:hypothetical protein C1645_763417, partial [Glomus cerebriforme]
ICFGFDEVLEMFNVHFIKQNITRNIIDETKLKANIKVAQMERERVDLLLSEYLENTSIFQSERTIDSRRKIFYKLITMIIRYPKNEEKYLFMKSKYWNVCWPMKKFQAIYMMKRFNYLDLNEIRKDVDLLYILLCFLIYKNDNSQFLQNRQSKYQFFFA